VGLYRRRLVLEAQTLLIMNFLTDISYAHEPRIIAELGINHGGSLERAKYLASLAIDSGAHVIKTQLHIPYEEMSSVAKDLIPGHCDQSIYSIMEECSLTIDEEMKLKDHIESQGGTYLSTPFSIKAAEVLHQHLGVQAFKIGSGECNNLPLLKQIASYSCPVILSTGMNDLNSSKRSYNYLLQHGCPKVYLMHTTNIYPTSPELVRLGAISELQGISSVNDVGLSDHTTSNLACLGAVALGAVLLERHFIDNKDHPGPDVSNSMTPEELLDLRASSVRMFQMRGGTKNSLLKEEEDTREFAFATVVLTQDLPAGTVLRRSHLIPKRPRKGDFLASSLENLLGRTLSADLTKDTHLLHGHLI